MNRLGFICTICYLFVKTNNLQSFKPEIRDCSSNFTCQHLFNSFLASGNLCPLLITFANSLDPAKDPQNVSFDLDPNHLTL